MTRNNQGQYTKKNRGLIPLFFILAIIGVALYFAGNKEEVVIQETMSEMDKRIESDFKAKELSYKLQSKLSILEKDRLAVIEENKIQLSRIETEYKKALLDERDRNAKELFKVNSELDKVRKELLATSTPN